MIEHQEWECGQCGYVHKGKAPPDHCPMCNALSEDFSATTKEFLAEQSHGTW